MTVIQLIKIMNGKLQKIVKWPYFHPVFSEDTIEKNVTLGLAQSAVNLAVWSAAAGLIVKLAGGKHPYRVALIAAGVFVAAEVLFGASGSSSNGHHLQIVSGTPGSPTASTSPNILGSAVFIDGGGAGFNTGENINFGSAGNGFDS